MLPRLPANLECAIPRDRGQPIRGPRRETREAANLVRNGHLAAQQLEAGVREAAWRRRPPCESDSMKPPLRPTAKSASCEARGCV